MCGDGARLSIKIFQFGDAPHQTRIEGRDIVDVVAEPYTEITENDQGEEVRTPTFSIFLGTSDGKTFVVTVNEIPNE